MRGYKKPTVSIIGASGYSGAELTGILMRHPSVKLDKLYAHSQAGKKVSDLYPSLNNSMTYEQYEGSIDSDICFLALPHGQALELVPALRDAGKMVIDLSGDFRIKNPDEHLEYYKNRKPEGAWMTYAMPELFHDSIAGSKAVSNPGCYATSIILGLAPLLRKPMEAYRVSAVNCTAISGLSGAGRSSKTELSYAEMNDNVRAYKVGLHQHTPEIMQALGSSATAPGFDFMFTPMIAPLTRGIYTVLNVRFEEHAPGIEQATGHFRDFYASAPFVRMRDCVPEVRDVTHTNFCDINIAGAGNGRDLVIVTAIDNLVKGAAGQAVQNMNIMLGYDQTLGIA